ncbi:MAG: penicillin-binding protein activator LpoB [Spirochaetes bacterium]|nr:penicillin-binding protein activator LpoB [Spirochaetota bacterium]
MFKKATVIFSLLAAFAAGTAFSQAPVPLDTAISNAANQFTATVPGGARLAVTSMVSASEALSNYIINQLNVALVNTNAFIVVPRGEIEVAAARTEQDRHLTEFISLDTQAGIGHEVGANAVISGEIQRETPTSFRLTIHIIAVEAVVFISSFSGLVVDNQQMATLIGAPQLIPDYTLGERLQMSALNTFFGIASITRGYSIGWGVAGLQGFGIISLLTALSAGALEYEEDFHTGERVRDEFISGSRRTFNTIGFIAIGTGAVFGWVIPFLHTRPGAGTPVAAAPLPFNIELVSTNNRDINGVRIMHRISF